MLRGLEQTGRQRSEHDAGRKTCAHPRTSQFQNRQTTRAPHQLILPLYNIESSSSQLRGPNGPEGLVCLDASFQNIPEYRKISPMFSRCKQKNGTFPDNSFH